MALLTGIAPGIIRAVNNGLHGFGFWHGIELPLVLLCIEYDELQNGAEQLMVYDLPSAVDVDCTAVPQG